MYHLTPQITDSPPLTAMDQLRSIAAPWRKRNKKANFLYKQFRACLSGLLWLLC